MNRTSLHLLMCRILTMSFVVQSGGFRAAMVRSSCCHIWCPEAPAVFEGARDIVQPVPNHYKGGWDLGGWSCQSWKAGACKSYWLLSCNWLSSTSLIIALLHLLLTINYCCFYINCSSDLAHCFSPPYFTRLSCFSHF